MINFTARQNGVARSLFLLFHRSRDRPVRNEYEKARYTPMQIVTVPRAGRDRERERERELIWAPAR